MSRPESSPVISMSCVSGESAGGLEMVEMALTPMERSRLVHNRLCGLHEPPALKKGRTNSDRLRSEAEDAGLTVTENLDFGFFASCVELL